MSDSANRERTEPIDASFPLALLDEPASQPVPQDAYPLADHPKPPSTTPNG